MKALHEPSRRQAAHRVPVTVIRPGRTDTCGRLLFAGDGKTKVELASGAVITVPSRNVLIEGGDA